MVNLADPPPHDRDSCFSNATAVPAADPIEQAPAPRMGMDTTAALPGSSSYVSPTARTFGSTSPCAAPGLSMPPVQKTCPSPATSQAATQTSPSEMRSIPGKGVGLVATANIRSGERIICEPWLLRIERNEPHLVWKQYQQLGTVQQEVYDKLHAFVPPGLDLGLASRVHLLDDSNKELTEDDTYRQTKEHVRVMEIFAANIFQVAGGWQAVFAITSRLNHSCIPNVSHSYNPTLQRFTVHTTRDVARGEELVTNYLGAFCHVSTRRKRCAALEASYGFTCQCLACWDPTLLSDARHELLGGITWGIQEFRKGRKKGNGRKTAMIPEDAVDAAKMAEDAVQLLLQQRLFGVELKKAYHLASALALDIHAMDKAIDYAYKERDVELNIMGDEVDDLKKAGTASQCWVKLVRRVVEMNDCQITPENRQKLGLNDKNYSENGPDENMKPSHEKQQQQLEAGQHQESTPDEQYQRHDVMAVRITNRIPLSETTRGNIML